MLLRLWAGNFDLFWSPGGRGGHSLSPDAVLIEGIMGRNRKNQAGSSVPDLSSQLLGRLRQEDYRRLKRLAWPIVR